MSDDRWQWKAFIKCHKAKRNLQPKLIQNLHWLPTVDWLLTTYLALDHGLDNNHLGGAMHFLYLAGYGMTHARIEPHQIPLGPVHFVCYVPLAAASFGLRRLALSLHLLPIRCIRIRFPILLVPRLVLTQCGKRWGERAGGNASRSFKRRADPLL